MELLSKKDYDKLRAPLMEVDINNLFARSVIEYKVSGKVYVDNVKAPRTFYVVHPYGMSLLFGNPQNWDFNKEFLAYSLNKGNIRDHHEWMQVYPKEWEEILDDLYCNCMIPSGENKNNIDRGVVEINTRVNFRFNREQYLGNRTVDLPGQCKIVPTDKVIFEKMKGKVIPSNFWDSSSDFIKNGAGVSLFCNDQLAATAYSAFLLDDKLELGIETMPDFRGNGFAFLTCSALIDYCMQKGYEPVWACNLANEGSFRLARKLGFVADKEIPYYRLSN